MTARFKRLLAKFLIGAVLFAQFTVAAYACPQVTSDGMRARDVAKTPSAMVGMPGCDQMVQESDFGLDVANPAVCLEHCRQGKQTAGNGQVPTVPPAILAGFTVLSPVSEYFAPAKIAVVGHPIAPAASPPLSILHCCFRI